MKNDSVLSILRALTKNRRRIVRDRLRVFLSRLTNLQSNDRNARQEIFHHPISLQAAK